MNKDKADFIYTCFNVFRLVLFVIILVAAYIVLENFIGVALVEEGCWRTNCFRQDGLPRHMLLHTAWGEEVCVYASASL